VKTLFLSLMLLISSLSSAMSIDEIIQHSLSKSPSLESINKRIKANEKSIEIAGQYANPELSLVRNTLNSSQAMSKTVLTLKQKIPYPSKLNAREEIQRAEDGILKAKLTDAKVKLVEKMKLEAYNIWQFNELLNIVEKYISLTQQNIEIFESYVSGGSNQHMGIMKAKLSLSDLQIKKRVLHAQLDAAYARLSYLAAFGVEKLTINLQITTKPNLQELKKSLLSNTLLGIKEKELHKKSANTKLATINNYPDLTLIGGVAYRENFDNYYNLGFALSLPMYGTEDKQEQRSRIEQLVVSSEKEDISLQIDAKLKAYYARMLSSYDIYHIVQDDALPQVEHMFELSNASISTGSDLFEYIDVLFDKLKLEIQSINAVANYSRAKAQIQALTGALQ